METTSTTTPFDLKQLSMEFLTTVIHGAGGIIDYGAVKVVPTASAMVLLVDETALRKTERIPRKRVDVAPGQSFVVLRSGFNVDTALQELRAGRFSCISGNDVSEYLERLRKGNGRVSVVSPTRDSASDERPAIDRNAPAASSIDQSSVTATPASPLQAAGGPVFVSPAMQRIDADLSRIARFHFDVLISGETGSGKDVAAYEIHRRSDRRDLPFLTVPLATLCSSLVESELFGHVRGAYSGATETKPGKFEAAQGGTVYLPEISNLSEDLQLKLLYFMQYKRCLRVGEDPRHQERRCDVRLIMASNEDLEECVRAGRMREDFYYRIKGLGIAIPPLRERRDDIPPLVDHFLRLYLPASESIPRFTVAAMDWMRKQEWPGNVRELENFVRSLLVSATGALIDIDDVLAQPGMKRCSCRHSEIFERESGQLMEYREFTEQMQALYIEQCLRRAGNDIASAARLSGLTPHGFRKAIERLGLQKA